MTPRQADVAFVLESVAGARALYAITAGPAAAHYDFAVEHEYGGRVLAEVHYALLRVLTHDDCARVFFFHREAPRVLSDGAQILILDATERAAARARVPPPEPRPPIVTNPLPPPTVKAPSVDAPLSVLVIDDDDEVQAVVREVVDEHASAIPVDVEGAARAARARYYDLVLCDAKRAFGKDGLLAKLPLDIASRVLVLAWPSEIANARWRLQGTERILTKPLTGWILRERLTRATAFRLLWEPDMEKIVVPIDGPRRRLTEPASDAPFTVLLAGIDDEVHGALRRILRDNARHVMKHDPGEAADAALSTPFHVILCSANAALHSRSFLDAIAREDPDGADRVLVVAPARDVPYVKHKLAQMRRENTVLALPIDDAALRHEVFSDHPSLAARVAVSELGDAPACEVKRARFRRLAVLVVDDDQTTQILFAAAGAHAEADVTLATTSIDAFEHVVSRPVDLLVVSATMRGDGGEPFYRVLWRLKPELKSRTVLVMAPDLVPPSAPRSQPPRILERPLTRDAVGRIVALHAERA